MLGWLGSATYSRWLVNFLFLLFLFSEDVALLLVHYVFPSLDSWRRACSWTLGATIYVRMRRIGPSEHVPLRTVRGEKGGTWCSLVSKRERFWSEPAH